MNQKNIIGTLTVLEPFKHTEQFEYAAWFRTNEVQPGVYPIEAVTVAHDGTICQVRVDMKAKITGGCLRSAFGGVAIGGEDPINREIGRDSEVRFGWHVISNSDARYSHANPLAMKPYGADGDKVVISLTAKLGVTGEPYTSKRQKRVDGGYVEVEETMIITKYTLKMAEA